MEHSIDRILTTHVGSLPRPDSVATLLFRKEHGQDYDSADFDKTIKQAVHEVVARQRALGIDIPSDGEMSKMSYATYVHDRLSGFGGDNQRKVALDLRDHPNFREKIGRMTGNQPMRRTSCIGPIALRDRAPLDVDIANFRAALSSAEAGQGFLTSASPGLVSAFQPNEYYPTHEEYLEAVAEAMRPEYEAIVDAGFILQVDCPDLAMARHTGFQDLTEEEFLARAEKHIEVLNRALSNIPSSSIRMHVCWGNYEGPHDFDIPLQKIVQIILKSKAGAISFEASNPRHQHEWIVWQEVNLPDDKILIPGTLDTSTNFVEHPELVAQRICRFADVVGRERVMAGTDCGLGTFAGYGKLDPDICYKKLKSMVDGAEIASSRLWS